MSTYVISDIHGCCNEFLSMLEKIRFSESDNLILAGDYIDRGKQSYEMLKWLEQCLPNVLLLRGNHEEEI
ncbi:metallophosphoesterase [Acetatifactor muris]|uniref:metallophosphoesterase n=1 Tax=Acetatifactor muris TaxID=879566 RepID=UPI0023F2BB9E|nr:metallophosphoesterase [Acetatifactor muris]